MARIRAIAWFDESIANGNWRLDSSSEALAAYREAIAAPYYLGSWP